MASLYNIEQELIDLFGTIENSDGEVSEEQYNALCIKQEELKAKLEAYYRAICIWESDADCCKNEKKRINDVQNKYKNRIDRLKSAMLAAVQTFGEHGKTNMFIELPTMRLSTRASKSIEVDSNRMAIFMSEFVRYIQELYTSGIISEEEEPDMEGILACINANVVAEYPDLEPFTLADLNALSVSIVTTDTFENFFKRHAYALQELGSDPICSDIVDNTTKENWKRYLDLSEASGNRLTLAKYNKNVTLQIK